MLKNIFCALLSLLVLTAAHAADIEKIGDALDALGAKDLLSSSGIDLDKALDCLDWETLNVSLTADMESVLETRGRTARVDSVIYKRGVTGIRIDLKAGLRLREGNKPLTIPDCFMLRFPLKDKAFLAVPVKKGYLELDPEKSRELLGDMKKKRGAKNTVLKKEKLGTEQVDGRLCDKMHIVTTTESGMKNDIMLWLARDLSGFPVKILLHYEAPRGAAGTSTTLFKNIIKTEPDSALFDLPKDYEQYDNLLELATEGRAGSHLEDRRDRAKRFDRRQR